MVLRSGESSLVYSSTGSQITTLLDYLYFSFITATSTGFGDIVPLGFSKVLAIIEVVVGLTIFAFVTSKLVSIRQEAILREVYEISLNEKVNRIRSSLYLYRLDTEKIIIKVIDGKIRKREIEELWSNFSFFETRINEILELFGKRAKRYVKDIGQINIELLCNSVNLSFDKTVELVKLLEKDKIEWKKKIAVSKLKDIIGKASFLYNIISKKRFGVKELNELKKDFVGKRKVLEKSIRPI